MKSVKLLAAAPRRQLTLSFDNSRLDGLGSLEQDKIVQTLAQILMQAAGLRVEGLDDDKR